MYLELAYSRRSAEGVYPLYCSVMHSEQLSLHYCKLQHRKNLMSSNLGIAFNNRPSTTSSSDCSNPLL
jgi:hypothetical protein